MRRCALSLAVLLVASTAHSATPDPFVGTWVRKLEAPTDSTIRYALKDLGGNRYALTGSTGTTIELKADGVPVKTPDGSTVSFRKIDDRTWEQIRTGERNMVRTYSVSADDATLTLHDVFKGKPQGQNYDLMTMYKRLAPGKGLLGEWQSFSMVEKAIGSPQTMVIAPFKSGGLSFGAGDKHPNQLMFDGKQYDEGDGYTTSGRRINDHVIEMDNQSGGKQIDHQILTLSNGGKTLTVVTSMTTNAGGYTHVWEKR